MPKSLRRYADKDLAREYRNRQRKANYAACPGDPSVSHRRWERWEEEMVSYHLVTDREISLATGRSVRAIQIKRHKMRKEGGQGVPGQEE